MEYTTKDSKIIFVPYYNKELDNLLLKKYNQIIFSDYELKENIVECYENLNFKDCVYIENIFNKSVNNLPNSITHLTFGVMFNQTVNNLPNSITHLTFGYKFNQRVDNLPNSVTHLTFGHDFNKKINKFPQNLSLIKTTVIKMIFLITN